jgi:Mn2+/Fe2+ NRAMP family transporter
VIGETFTGQFGWVVSGGLLSTSFLLLISANIGTTIAPWQLFFQQSCVVDKGLLVKDIKASWRDLMLGVMDMCAGRNRDHRSFGTISALSAERFVSRRRPWDCWRPAFIAAVVITAGTAWANASAVVLASPMQHTPARQIHLRRHRARDCAKTTQRLPIALVCRVPWCTTLCDLVVAD